MKESIYVSNDRICTLLTHSHTMTPFDVSRKEAFSKHCGKEENAGNRHFLLFPQCFLLCQRKKLSFMLHLFYCLQVVQGQFFVVWEWVNSLPNDKILDRSKFKAFAEDMINMTEKLNFVLGRVETIVEKGENAGYQHFLLFPQCFQKASSVGLCCKWLR